MSHTLINNKHITEPNLDYKHKKKIMKKMILLLLVYWPQSLLAHPKIKFIVTDWAYRYGADPSSLYFYFAIEVGFTSKRKQEEKKQFQV